MVGETQVIELRGTIVVDADRETDRAWVEAGRITFERPADGARRATVLSGWVLPGLVDVHCHVGLGPGGPVDRETARAQALADRDSGVLAIRDAGSPVDTSWVHEDDTLPRLIRAGHHVARPKRYLRGYAREIAPGQLAATLAEEAVRGDGWVKIVADWIDRDLGSDGDLRPLWEAAELKDAIAAAHEHGARVTAHVFSTEALPDLLDAGIDCLEHGTGLTPDMIMEIAARGVPVTPTLLQVDQFEAIAAQATRFPVFAARMRRLHAGRFEHVRALHEAGVQLLVGTDAGGTIEHGRIAEEAAELVRAGVPAKEVVAAASWRTRAYLGLDSLTEQAGADLVLYAGDPRSDIAQLARPSAVVLRGSLLPRPE